MLTQKIIDLDNKETGSMELKGEIFGVKPKKHLIKDVVVMQLAGKRSGNAETKTRKDVRGGGKKPFRQKGTGNARQGTSRSPLMPGGGIVFGPHKRDYSFRLPKKVRRAALAGVLSLKKSEDKLVLFENLGLKEAKTKVLSGLFANMKLKSALVVDLENRNLELSIRNLPGFKYVRPEGINVFDLLKFENLVMTKGSMQKVEEALLK
jgi:large subunit ribosomal protein L4